MFWWGVITCFLAGFGLFLLLLIVRNAFAGGGLSSLGYSVPIFFWILMFLTIGGYMIASDLRKEKPPKQGKKGLTKRKVVVLAVILVLGATLIGLASSSLTS